MPIDFEGAKHYALARLEHDVPAALVYHSLGHTRDSVVPAAERLAARAGVEPGPLLLLRTAAWYHDLGFVEARSDHEAIGVRIAATILPRFGYTRAEVALIGGMIMATKLPQAPQTTLESLLADADLDVLGRPDFLVCNQDLRTELQAFGVKMSDEQWYRNQLKFLETHQYWTAAARTLRNGGKQRNMLILAELLAHYEYQP